MSLTASFAPAAPRDAVTISRKFCLYWTLIQLNPEAGELCGIDMAFLDQFVEGFDDTGRGGCCRLGVEVI